MGWNDESVKDLILLSNNAATACASIEEVVAGLEKEAASMNATQMEEQYKKLYAAKSNLLYRFFINWGAKKNMDNAGAEAYRKGLNSICVMYKACLLAIKTVWVDDNKLLDLFRKSPAQLEAENKQK
jgi:hypothetical protein